MSGSLSQYLRSQHGELGIGKRPDELARPDPRVLELIQVNDAARMLDISWNSVASMIKAGRLTGFKVDGRLHVRRGDVERLRGVR